jgi:hypothetical protein
LRERIAFFVSFVDSILITSPKPGSSREAISAGRQDQMTSFCDLLADGSLDFALLVRDERLSRCVPTVTRGGPFESRPAKVIVKAFGSSVRDGDNAC